jgi:hypothetical protein
MAIIKVSNNYPNWPLLRQTPGSLGIWGGHQFLVNQNVEHCDAWVVLEGIDKPESTICPPEKVILLATEPPAIKNYHKKWLSQFSAVSSYQKNIVPGRLLKRNPTLPWWVGKSYDELVASPFPEKKNWFLPSLVGRKQRRAIVHVKKFWRRWPRTDGSNLLAARSVQ